MSLRLAILYPMFYVLPSLFADENSRSTCYLELGCFPSTYPWTSAARPFPEPASPYEINTNLLLYTRINKEIPHRIQLWPVISTTNTTYQIDASYNVFVIHGYLSDGDETHMIRFKNAYLNKRNANVFIVDWSGGAKTANYLQAASNTRIVGAELARFAIFLQKQHGVSPTTIHVIGHSLGAQIGSYFGKRFPGIDRLTALDPAQPGFEYCDERVRLTKTDALFAETLHTNVRPFVFLGYGMMEPVAHVDIYANGGFIQPGCPFTEIFTEKRKSNLEDLIHTVACSHLRALSYAIEALENDECTFWAHPVKDTNYYQSKTGLSIRLTVDQLFSSIPVCTPQTCFSFGLDNVNYSARGVYLLPTNSNPPFCKTS